MVQHGIFHKGYANFVVRFSSGYAGLSISALILLLQLTGTRWIAHKYHALEVIMDKYGIYMQHLENMTEDESFPAKERTKFKGWHKKWTMGRIPILACVAIELFAPAKILSKSFQS